MMSMSLPSHQLQLLSRRYVETLEDLLRGFCYQAFGRDRHVKLVSSNNCLSARRRQNQPVTLIYEQAASFETLTTMTIKKMTKFTPEVLLSAPRRSTGIPSADGMQILYTESTYSFEKQTSSVEIRVVDVKTSETKLVTDNKQYSNPCWLDNDTIALLKAKDDDTIELVLGPVTDFEDKSYSAGGIGGPADNLKITKLGSGFFGVAVTAMSNPDGSIHNPKRAPKPRSTGRLYKSLFVRHWDTWVTPQRNSIFYGALLANKSHLSSGQTMYSLSPMTNALKGTAFESPIPPFGGSDHFDISKSGIVFVAKDPDLDPALNTKCSIYLVPLSNYLETTPEIFTVVIHGFEGAMTSPAFSSDGKKVAFLAMRTNGYEADQNQILVMPNVRYPAWVHQVLDSDEFSFSPQSVVWSHDGGTLYWTAETTTTRALFGAAMKPELDPFARSETMRMIYDESSVDAISVIEKSGNLLLSSSNLIDSRIYSILDVRLRPTDPSIFSNKEIFYMSYGHTHFGLKEEQLDRLYSPPADPTLLPDWCQSVESIVVRPSYFDSSKRYPLALLIHGGPQGAWLDSWSTRWNPAVFAEQGYVVVCPNPTGSTGYGQKFTDGIKEQWAGTPYQDIVNVFEHIEKHVDYIDTSRAVALGASYGGYMANWIQGQDLGRKFKALVTHDGVFSMSYELATDELYFIKHDVGAWWSDGPEARKKYAKWDPALFTENWATPHLVIHSEKDYRLTISDGLAAFNTLQIKGVESEFLSFPDENHWVLNPENSLVWHTTVFNFINKHVGLPAYEPKFAKESDVLQDPSRA